VAVGCFAFAPAVAGLAGVAGVDTCAFLDEQVADLVYQSRVAVELEAEVAEEAVVATSEVSERK